MTHKQDKIKQSKSLGLLLASIVAILIGVSPFIFYSYIYVPSGPVWDTFFGTIHSNYYLDVNDLAWIFLGKFVPFYLFILWFLTCKHWWYHVLLIPIAMYGFQIFYVFNDEQRYFDEVEIYLIVPVIAIIAPIVYLIRLKIFEKYVQGIDFKKIEKELDEYNETEDPVTKND